eukprot:CAMPEP_0118710518 /NCGR_PEP_ID=MMETSP0800-20121206/23434_1 /TAXON_ID=210618 ORGANISM="Striatella unipunctata, Strain CCMP2910" /NCGR_SAMPLE_ID=MMETSP0800 /ASSEMBLY_ACC=CAM_ASM_000638 /LENGTH=68 /DNA_ID=CAMNT_0006614725 /DNA_START=38 /DNA_END=244 /DNA_ORIENTATION=-
MALAISPLFVSEDEQYKRVVLYLSASVRAPCPIKPVAVSSIAIIFKCGKFSLTTLATALTPALPKALP